MLIVRNLSSEPHLNRSELSVLSITVLFYAKQHIIPGDLT